jgi:hypothetical protein
MSDLDELIAALNSLQAAQQSQQQTKQRGPSDADKLVRLALDSYIPGRSSSGDLYGAPIDGTPVVRMLRGGRHSLRAELAARYWQTYDRAVGDSALSSALAVVEGMAQTAPPEDVHVRVAPDGADGIVLDLGREDGATVHVTTDGWTVQNPSPRDRPALFRRSQLINPLPVPERGGDVAELRELLNVTDSTWPMLLAWAVAALFPDIAHPLAYITGQHGAAKTTAAAMLVSLLDPSAAPMAPAPRDMDQWGLRAAASWVVGLDNLSSIPAWLSDALCCAVTGTAIPRRKLYTDSDLAVLAYRRVLVLNGIEVGAIRGDLADRMIPIELLPIRDTDRRTDGDVWGAWRQAHPRILGGLLDTAVQVLRHLPMARESLVERPRMADFAEIAAALDLSCGTRALDHYWKARETLSETVIESDAVATAIQAIAHGRRDSGGPPWRGTPTALLDVLRVERPEDAKQKGWPRTPKALSDRLARVEPDLGKLGVTITRGRSGGGRWIEISAT